MGSDWRAHPQISCGSLWGIVGPSLCKPLCRASTTTLARYPFSSLPLCLLVPPSATSPRSPVLYCPIHLGPCVGPALSLSLTLPLFLSLPLLSYVLVAAPAFISVSISPSVFSFVPCAISLLPGRGTYAQPVPLALLTSRSSVSKLNGTQTGFLQRKGQRTESREGPSYLAPSCPGNARESLEMLCSLS